MKRPPVEDMNRPFRIGVYKTGFNWGWPVAFLVVASLFSSAYGLVEVAGVQEKPDRDSYQVKVVEKEITKPPPPPKPEPKPEPVKESPPKPEPEKKTKKPDKKKKPEPPPEKPPKKKKKPPLAQVKKPEPKTHKSAEEPPDKPVKEVFGVDKNSVSDKGEKAVPVGNKLMKEPEEEFTEPEDVKETYRAPQVSKPPRYLVRKKPAYPRQALDKGVEGVVKIEVVVDERGRPGRTKVIKSLGSELDSAAVEAVKKWRFVPARMDGERVACKVIVPVVFRIR
ncbi:MAG: TonB family protein [bacterium]